MTRLNQAYSIVGFQPEGRPKDDFYPTPASVTEALLSKVKFNGSIWECACGKGDMSDVLINNGYTVISTDLVDYGYGDRLDFLSATTLLAPNIITNPPFKLAQDFIEKSMELECKSLSLFLKLAFLEGQKRKKLFEKYPPKFVYVFSKRQMLTRNGEEVYGAGLIAFAWYYWERGYTELPRIDWI